jgi:hypothetical protein
MKTIRYQEIDGHKIVTGFDCLRMDPVATVKKVDQEIVKTEEYKKQDDAIAAYRAVRSPKRATPRQLEAGLVFDPVDFARYQRERKAANELVCACADKLGAKRGEYMLAFREFFLPRKGEHVPDDPEVVEDMELAAKQTPPGKRLDIDGNTIDDHRGKSYFTTKGDDVEEIKIKKLGEKPPAGAVTESELSDLHRRILERNRKKEQIAHLSPEERAAAAEAEINDAASEAAKARSMAEIKGVSAATALKDSQAQFEAAKAEIEAVYGV